MIENIILVYFLADRPKQSEYLLWYIVYIWQMWIAWLGNLNHFTEARRLDGVPGNIPTSPAVCVRRGDGGTRWSKGWRWDWQNSNGSKIINILTQIHDLYFVLNWEWVQLPAHVFREKKSSYGILVGFRQEFPTQGWRFSELSVTLLRFFFWFSASNTRYFIKMRSRIFCDVIYSKHIFFFVPEGAKLDKISVYGQYKNKFLF